MMKKKSVIILATLLLSASWVMAADKVVVVPLGTTTNASPPDDSWLKLYDSNNTFIGYVFKSNIKITTSGISLGLVVNDKKFCASIDSSGSVYPTSFALSSRTYFLTEGCTGTPYLANYWDSSKYSNGFNETICNDVLYDPDWAESGPFYIDKNPITLTPDDTFWLYDPLCTSDTAGGMVLYPLIPNDPAVTGFQNSYVPPLHLEGYSLSVPQQ